MIALLKAKSGSNLGKCAKYNDLPADRLSLWHAVEVNHAQHQNMIFFVF